MAVFSSGVWWEEWGLLAVQGTPKASAVAAAAAAAMAESESEGSGKSDSN